MDPVKALRDAADQHRAAVAQEEKSRGRRDRAIAKAIEYGVRPAVVHEITGLSNQHIRRISGKRKPPSPTG